MRKKDALWGGAISFIGYILSPLSWWNDAFVNIPLAWIFATIICLILPLNFSATMIFFYWATNFAGIVLMHAGSKKAMRRQIYGRDIARYIITSLAYTIVLVFLIDIGLIKNIRW